MGYSKYPTNIDDSESLPVAIDYVTPIAAEAVNRLRDAILAAQAELGKDPSREYGTVRARLDAMSALITSLRTDLTILEELVELIQEPGGILSSTSGIFICPASVSVRDVVYLSSSSTVDKAKANSATKRPAIGVVTSKPSTTTAVVYFYGEVGGFAGLTPGDTIFLSETDGLLTSTAPTAYGSSIQKIGTVKSASTIVLMTTSNFIEL